MIEISWWAAAGAGIAIFNIGALFGLFWAGIARMDDEDHP